MGTAHDDLENRWTLQQNAFSGKWRVVDNFWGTTSAMEFDSRGAAERDIDRLRRNKIEGMRRNAASDAVADQWADA